MQGFTFNTFGKGEWVAIHALMESADFACIQESGAISLQYRYIEKISREDYSLFSRADGAMHALYFRWRRDLPKKSIVGNYRCSLCIITKNVPDEAFSIEYLGKGRVYNRPILAALFTDSEFDAPVIIYNVHAPANAYLSRRYLQEQIPKMRTEANRRNAKWICGGDFNLPPHEVQVFLDDSERIVRTGSPTHMYSDEKDFFIVSDGRLPLDAYHASDLNMANGGSDHFPVVISSVDPWGKRVEFGGSAGELKEAVELAKLAHDGRRKTRLAILDFLARKLERAELQAVEDEEIEARADMLRVERLGAMPKTAYPKSIEDDRPGEDDRIFGGRLDDPFAAPPGLYKKAITRVPALAVKPRPR